MKSQSLRLEPWNSLSWPTTTKPTPAMQELYRLLLKSEKFIEWGKISGGISGDWSRKISGRRRTQINRKTGDTSVDPASSVEEKHFTPQQLAKAWGVDVETIRNVFRVEPGALKISNASKLRTTLRIPRDVAERVHRRLAA